MAKSQVKKLQFCCKSDQKLVQASWMENIEKYVSSEYHMTTLGVSAAYKSIINSTGYILLPKSPLKHSKVTGGHGNFADYRHHWAFQS